MYRARIADLGTFRQTDCGPPRQRHGVPQPCVGLAKLTSLQKLPMDCPKRERPLKHVAPEICSHLSTMWLGRCHNHGLEWYTVRSLSCRIDTGP